MTKDNFIEEIARDLINKAEANTESRPEKFMVLMSILVWLAHMIISNANDKRPMLDEIIKQITEICEEDCRGE